MDDRHQTTREVQEHHEHANATREQFDLLGAVEHERESHHEQGAEYGTSDRANAADHGDGDHPKRLVEVEEQAVDLELAVASDEGQESAGECRQTTRHTEREQLRPIRRDGVGRSRILVVAGGDDRSPDSGATQSPDQHDGNSGHEKAEPVDAVEVGALHLPEEQAETLGTIHVELRRTTTPWSELFPENEPRSNGEGESQGDDGEVQALHS